MIFGRILSWLTGGVLDRVLSSVDHAVSNETKREEIRTVAATRFAETAADERADARRYRTFWIAWFMFSGSVGLWFCAITLDTVFQFAWDVADYPPSVKPYVDTIIASIFGSGGAVAAAQAISSAIRGRK